jgi:integrase
VQERTEDGIAISTIRRELGELTTTLKALVDARRISHDDLPKLTLPTAENARPHFLTYKQKSDLLAMAMTRNLQQDRLSRIELFVHIGLETGQRRRAIERLEWDQVDFDARMIHFRKRGEPVTKKRKPSVPMSQTLELILRDEYEHHKTRWVQRHDGSIRTSFESLVRACHLENITPHSLRHTFVSHLLMRGVSIYDVAQLAGMTVKMVELTYGHLTPEYLRSVLDGKRA